VVRQVSLLFRVLNDLIWGLAAFCIGMSTAAAACGHSGRRISCRSDRAQRPSVQSLSSVCGRVFTHNVIVTAESPLTPSPPHQVFSPFPLYSAVHRRRRGSPDRFRPRVHLAWPNCCGSTSNAASSGLACVTLRTTIPRLRPLHDFGLANAKFGSAERVCRIPLFSAALTAAPATLSRLFRDNVFP